MSADLEKYDFDNDERVFINHLSENENIAKFSRGKLLNMILFQKALITDETDEEVRDLVDGTLMKISNMTDEEWGNLRNYLPFPCLDEEIYSEETAE